MNNILIQKILITIKFKNIFPDIIKILPRTTLFIYFYNFINNKLKLYHSSNIDYNIILFYKDDNIEIKINWNNIIGIFYDTLFTYYGINKKIILYCEYNNKKIEYPITNVNFMIQQIFKFGLASIRKSVKFFMNLEINEINNYVTFCSTESTINNQELFFNTYKKICNDININISFVFINKNNLFYYLYKFINNNETLYEIINNIPNFNIKNKKIIINGIDFEIIKNIYLKDIILNIISTNFFIHVCYYDYEIMMDDI